MFSVILRKEITSFFTGLSGYLITVVFLLSTSLMLWVIPGQYNILDSGYSNLNSLFEISQWLFIFLCPALTMKTIADEKQNGTWELLATKPIGIFQIVFGKFLASWILVIITLIPTIIFLITVYYIAEPVGNVDLAAFWGSFIGLIFGASVFVSIGVFSSSLSKNQMGAFVVGVAITFMMYYGFDMLAMLFESGRTISFIENIGIHAHYKSISRGVIDSRDIAYFIIVNIVFLYLTKKKLKIR
ncbi:MAG: gliding motility-associated ABC transporter permease subunit GldF [Bacteroidales bacterium 36-12]|nr:MAG: gliding motility-associated ABC transporter permease subunit GldF [Bacteroidales bacterium 36-12]